MWSDRSTTPLQRYLSVFRVPFAVAFAAMTTIALFYLMQSLIDLNSGVSLVEANGQIVEFIRLKEDLVLETKNRRPEPPPMPDEPPKVQEPSVDQVATTDSWSNVFAPPAAEVLSTDSLTYLSDGAYLPIMKVQPVYPTSALEQGLIGWVVVEFTVDEIGRVVDPIVIDHCVDRSTAGHDECIDRPGSVFDKPAIAAASKFKYKPRVVDGETLATAGVRHLISFELDQ